ncbi:MAG: pyridine nucleotide-disulfide oxidoreductase [Aerococcus urinaeequi]|uniref:pyridine nucleotide-disulfide oxidoreductase n=1 Tax=Aerococcus TaxID=1375 RepID=UPI001ED95236|nr:MULTISPECIES: pyridine nucleotide-disulfide oxidoreductase [Aerococcus]
MVNISKVKVICRTTRVFKPVIVEKTNEILWLRLFGEGAHEIINIITVAIKAHLPYTSLRDQIYTHPTLAE